MWEFFSLAQTPYPGIDPNRDLYLKLLNGYRMEKPKYANQKLYDVMLSCWNQKPETRPLFNELEKCLSALLHESVREHYVDLNEPYLQANAEYLKSNAIDYLSMMGPPETPAPPVPEDAVPLDEAPTVPGYLNMRGGYTPAASDDDDGERNRVAQQNNANKPKVSPIQKPPRKSKQQNVPEEIPMLETGGQANAGSDHENDAEEYKDVPMPKPKARKSVTSQYVNVPAETKVTPRSSTVNNPGYISMVTTMNEKGN